jgi:predicted membrane channel-forming protein YqfA (hemolysin III family)
MLQLTSLLFATNAAHALTTRHIFYAVALLFLTACSVAWHSAEKLNPAFMTRFWMDQVAAWSVVILSLFYITRIHSQYLWLALVFVLLAAGLSYYLCHVCSWNNENPFPHASLHLVACIGIHCILAGL